MKIELDARKSVHDNAAVYYNKAKRIRAKIPGLKKAIADTKKAIEAEEASEAAYEPPQKKAVREREWFEKFHWLRTSGGFLAIGGRDAKGNEAIVARHMEQNDLFFHADVAGASAVVLKNGQAAAEQDLAEVAQMAACFSRAWQSGTEACDVYCVKPGQVKTAAKAGEYLAKGSFVILGERKWFRGVRLALTLSVEGGRVGLGRKGVAIKPDIKATKGESAKKVLFVLKKAFPDAAVTLDDVLQALPNGGSRPAA